MHRHAQIHTELFMHACSLCNHIFIYFKPSLKVFKYMHIHKYIYYIQKKPYGYYIIIYKHDHKHTHISIYILHKIVVN